MSRATVAVTAVAVLAVVAALLVGAFVPLPSWATPVAGAVLLGLVVAAVCWREPSRWVKR